MINQTNRQGDRTGSSPGSKAVRLRQRLCLCAGLIAAMLASSPAWAQETGPAVDGPTPDEQTIKVDVDLDDLDMAEQAMAQATDADGPRYPVGKIELVYEQKVADQPDLEQLYDLRVELGLVEGNGYVAPRDGVVLVELPVRAMATPGRTYFHGSGLRALSAGIVKWFNDRGIVGVYVRPDERQISDTGKDKRLEGQTDLTLLVYTARVDRLRTVATTDDRFPTEQGINNDAHDRIRFRSPVGPGELVDKQLLDEYTYLLNRHPGRRVDVALAPSERAGGAVVDFLVTESKPWMVYYQVSNTGTKTTGEWRHRVGFVHNQLTGADDVLSIDFYTSGEASNAIAASYTRPLFRADRLKYRVNLLYSQYDASEVGQAGTNFQGDTLQLGGEVIWNFWQHEQWFADAFTGFTWKNISVDNQGVSVQGEENFLLYKIGAKLERMTETATTQALVQFEHNIGDAAGTEETEITKLGRVLTEPDYNIVSWSLSQSLYLEPLLNRKAWMDPSTPESSTLAHEVAVAFSGQYGFGDRLIPQEEGVVGGLYTVRGYDESTVAGDNTMVFTAEYRFHLPRMFTLNPDPSTTPLFGRPFRWAPQEVYGRPDWDLILRGFVDVGRAEIENKQILEQDETLVGAGVGVEVLFKRNASVRIDWATALEDAGDTQSGDQRVHVVATLLYLSKDSSEPGENQTTDRSSQTG